MAPLRGKLQQCAIQSIDCMIVVNITPETTGKQLIDMIFKQSRIFEKHWFGLMYYDSRGNVRWLDMEKKVNLKDVKPFEETSAHFKFTIKFFPENIRLELIQDEVKILFFKYELSRLVSNPQIEILPQHRVLCAVAYACLVSHERDNLSPEQVIEKKFDRIFPQRVLANFDLSKKDWLEAIQTSLNVAKDQHYTEPLRHALQAVEQSPMHGVAYYEIRNKNNTDLLLGVDCYGLTIYKPEDRVNPRVAFLWQEIHSVAYVGKAFHIKPLAKADPTLIIYTRSVTQNDEILSIIAGNHINYMRRRQGDRELVLEATEAKKAQETNDEEKLRFEKRREANLQYENKINGIMVMDSRKDDKEKQLQEEFKKAKEMLENQIIEANKIAEDEKRKKMTAEKESEELKRRAQEIENKLLSDNKLQKEIALLEADKVTLEKMRIQEVERLNQTLKEMQLKHDEDMKRLNSLQTQIDAKPKSINALPISPTKKVAEKPITYAQVKKQDNLALQNKINNFGTIVKDKMKVVDSTTSQVQIYAQAGLDKFQTLKNLRKNNTKARIDEFESF